MRLKPRPPDIGDRDGFTEDNDIFGYKQFGERLGKLFLRLEDVSIFLLDGAWGSGKSTFVRQFAGHCRLKGARVILFDAFRDDYQHDAFPALATEIYKRVHDSGADKNLKTKFLDRAGKAFRELRPLALDAMLTAASGGLVSGQDVKDAKERYDAETDPLAEALKNKLEDAVSQNDAIEAFRICLKQAAKHLERPAESDSEAVRETEAQPEESASWPLIFIIDELDRCRPDFALSILEIVKHVFSVEGVRFLLVANATQLENSVRHQYGTDAAQTYLEKFYDIRVTLPENNVRKTRTERYINLLVNSLPFEYNGFEYTLKEICIHNNIELRTIEKIIFTIFMYINARMDHVPDEVYVPICIIFITDKISFNDIKYMNFNSSIIEGLIHELPDNENIRNLWKWICGEKLSQEKEEYVKNRLLHGRFPDPNEPKKTVRDIAQTINSFRFARGL